MDHRATPARAEFVARKRSQIQSWWIEAMLCVLGYVVYTALRDVAPRRVAVADVHGLDILHFERGLHISVEATLNRWLALRPDFSDVATFWYSDAHFVVTIGVLLASLRMVRGRRLRLALYTTTAIALVVFWAFPTAPPRLLPQGGFVDVIAHLPALGSVSDPAVARLSNQYAAMPSLHVAWAVWCAVVVWQLVGSIGAELPVVTWQARAGRAALRSVAVAYPLATALIVLATANHYLSDVVAGALTAGVAFVVTSDAGVAGLRRAFACTATAVAGPTRP